MPDYQINFDRPLIDAKAVIGVGAPSSSDDSADGHGSVQAGEPKNDNVTPANPPQLSDVLNKIADGINNVESLVDSIANEMTSLSIQLAKVIVQKVVGSSKDVQEQRLTHILQDALKRPEPAIGVHVNPEQLEAIRDQFSKQEATANFAITADASLAPGDCRVEFASHELISDFEKQLQDIEQRLMEVVHES